jgi:splicing factor 3A subunit 1
LFIVCKGDNDIYRHLRDFAERRTDIFGDTELTIGQSIEEDARLAKKRERDRIIWDGHSTSINEIIAQRMMMNESQTKKGIAPAPPPVATKAASIPQLVPKPLPKVSTPAVPPPLPPVGLPPVAVPPPVVVPPIPYVAGTNCRINKAHLFRTYACYGTTSACSRVYTSSSTF